MFAGVIVRQYGMLVIHPNYRRRSAMSLPDSTDSTISTNYPGGRTWSLGKIATFGKAAHVCVEKFKKVRSVSGDETLPAMLAPCRQQCPYYLLHDVLLFASRASGMRRHIPLCLSLTTSMRRMHPGDVTKSEGVSQPTQTSPGLALATKAWPTRAEASLLFLQLRWKSFWDGPSSS